MVQEVGTPSETSSSLGSGSVIHLYRTPGLSESANESLIKKANAKLASPLENIEAELCFNIALSQPLTGEEDKILKWLLSETFEPDQLNDNSWLQGTPSNSVVEIGPRLSFSTAWSANAKSICESCGLGKVERVEVSRRYLLKADHAISAEDLAVFQFMVHDRMTEEVYHQPLQSFKTDVTPAPVYTVPLLERGRPALEEINEELGLGFDEWDKDYYLHMFTEDLKRDPTSVELFDMAQSNSEHSRHWFFGANLIVDGQHVPETLMSLVKDTLKANPNNSVIGFHDNSSAIRGRPVRTILPEKPGQACQISPQDRDLDVLLTAETHNFPCAVAPYPGAETGAGGRIRDTHATGTGSIMGVATAGYCVGNLQLEGEKAEWEDPEFSYPESLAPPLQILVDASNGASDYGNKFGEPLLAGYTRTFGLRLSNGERREWIKPIMFSGGLGQIDHDHLEKRPPDIGMLIVKIGGPAYRIGMGGGAASSVASGSNKADLDFNAVQRGDAEMSQKLWRVVRACVDLGKKNPIEQIHDQGAGGNCNVVKEIIYPLGATIDVREVKLGDETMSVLEIWGAEYQENDALLIKPENKALLESICARERCFMQVLGSISGSGKITLKDKNAPPDSQPPVDLDLEKVLGKMPRKTFEFTRRQEEVRADLDLSQLSSPQEAISRVLRLPSVGSKRFLTTKVDRCVTGAATAIGEQPLKGLINAPAMARLALAEALTNLVWAKATALQDIKASVNWMYAAKMDSEGAQMYDAAKALKEAMIALGLACDGGKDSLSMAASAGSEAIKSYLQVVKAPGNLVISAYVTCPDITLTVTPDLKLPNSGRLVHIDLGRGARRLGGSALVHAYSQVGSESPDVSSQDIKAMWEVTQSLIEKRLISAGHDISDGGIAVTLLEMAFASSLGVQVNLQSRQQTSANSGVAELFAEEIGLVIEVAEGKEEEILSAYRQAGLEAHSIGRTTEEPSISIGVDSEPSISGRTADLRDEWEETSFRIERLQAAVECVEQEQRGLSSRQIPQWTVPFTPSWTPDSVLASTSKAQIAIIREEGSNGDREMSSAIWMAGMQPWDVSMSDLLSGSITLDQFRGVVFVGGFSYADVLDSAKGWAGTIRHNPQLQKQFTDFYQRKDTWSLGVCNGCQLMALLGWVPGLAESEDKRLKDAQQPRFIHNQSGRFESRWSLVNIQESPSIMLKGMEGTTIGVWSAHGEGRAHFPDDSIRQQIQNQNLAPIRYCDASQRQTEEYPHNPNGSPEGIAGLCSSDGRHLAMMPHPERCFLAWQNPWYPADTNLQPDGPSPWLKLFQNAQKWCES